MTRISWRLEIHAELPSTSDHCLAAAAEGEPAGLAVMAARQSGGRGSRGRVWQSPAGNLYLSFLLRPDMKLTEAGIWPLLVSLALHDALAPLLADPAPLRLKWPNDVMLGTGKLAGILLDVAAGDDGRIASLVVGCGVNLAVAPDIPGRATASLADAGITPPPPADVARAVLNALDQRLGLLTSAGAGAIHAAWLARAHPPGTVLTVRFEGSERRGAFSGLSSEGHMRLATADGLITLSAGEVLLAPA